MSTDARRFKRLLREQMALAYDEELRRALTPLAAAFDDWKVGKLGSHDLSALIHEFHRGPASKLFSKYAHDDQMSELMVAHAIVSGVLDREKIPRELLEHLKKEIDWCQDRGGAPEGIADKSG